MMNAAAICVTGAASSSDGMAPAYGTHTPRQPPPHRPLSQRMLVWLVSVSISFIRTLSAPCLHRGLKVRGWRAVGVPLLMLHVSPAIVISAGRSYLLLYSLYVHWRPPSVTRHSWCWSTTCRMSTSLTAGVPVHPVFYRSFVPYR